MHISRVSAEQRDLNSRIHSFPTLRTSDLPGLTYEPVFQHRTQLALIATASFLFSPLAWSVLTVAVFQALSLSGRLLPTAPTSGFIS